MYLTTKLLANPLTEWLLVRLHVHVHVPKLALEHHTPLHLSGSRLQLSFAILDISSIVTVHKNILVFIVDLICTINYISIV